MSHTRIDVSGPQPQRGRIRATKALAGLPSPPTRDMRVAVRSLCTAGTGQRAQGKPVLTDLDACLNKNVALNQVANGLEAGQYFAPTFIFIFTENVKPRGPARPVRLLAPALPAIRRGCDHPVGDWSGRGTT